MDVDVSEEVCWICLGGPEDGELLAPCRCPRLLHPACLARWQLRRLSRQEGTHCRFCDMELPPWKDAAPAEPGGSAALVSIHIAGEVHQVCLPPGAAGAAAFKQQVEAITGSPFNDEMCMVSFVCRDPFDPGSTVTLQGISQFDDAMRCALISARERADGAASRTNSSVAGDCRPPLPAAGGGGGGGGAAGAAGGGNEGREAGDGGDEGEDTDADAGWPDQLQQGAWYGGQAGAGEAGLEAYRGGSGGGGSVRGGQDYYLMTPQEYEAARARLAAGLYRSGSGGGDSSGGGSSSGGVLGALWARGQRYWRRAVASCLAPQDEGAWPPRC